MSTEIEKLEYQPTNLELQQQFQQLDQKLGQMQQQLDQSNLQLTALNTNVAARILNATLQNDTDRLAPLVNSQTNTPVANFPATSEALTYLTWTQRRVLGISLNMSDPGAHTNAEAKKTFFQELRMTIGLKPSPA